MKNYPDDMVKKNPERRVIINTIGASSGCNCDLGGTVPMTLTNQIKK